MITPNKFISFDQSILAKLPTMLVNKKSIEIQDLYMSVAETFESIDEFMYALDVLYILNKVDVDFNLRTITYVN